MGGHVGVTSTTLRLLDYWTASDREKKLFFCQIEAVETAIYVAEVAGKYGDAWIENDLKRANDTSNPGLPRVALKMATGSGKTVVGDGAESAPKWSHIGIKSGPREGHMPVDLSVKQVPDEVADRLRKRAQRHHRSLQGELRAILEAAAEGETLADVFSAARRELRSAPHVVAPRSESALIIREDRDGRRFTIDDLLEYVRTLGTGTPDEAVDWIRGLRSTR